LTALAQYSRRVEFSNPDVRGSVTRVERQRKPNLPQLWAVNALQKQPPLQILALGKGERNKNFYVPWAPSPLLSFNEYQYFLVPL
jgi:hypothetical protein